MQEGGSFPVPRFSPIAGASLEHPHSCRNSSALTISDPELFLCWPLANTKKVILPSRTQTYNVTPLRRRICKPLIRRSYKAFAVNSVRKYANTKAAIVKVIG